VLQWARANCCLWPWEKSTCKGTTWMGHLHVLHWASPTAAARGMRTAVHVLPRSLKARAWPWGGHLAVLQWARANGIGCPDCPWDLETCMNAASIGHLGV
jgi:hypothetical protein